MKGLIDFWKRQGTATKVVLAIFIILAFRGVLIGVGVLPKPEEAKKEPTTTTAVADPSRISLVQYGMLSDGMSYADAVRLLGSAGTEVSSNNIGGSQTVMYQWKSGNLAGMNATFQHDKLVSKSQFGLR